MTYFTVYVFFPLWDEVNCRSLTPEVSGMTYVAVRGSTVWGMRCLLVTERGQESRARTGGDLVLLDRNRSDRERSEVAVAEPHAGRASLVTSFERIALSGREKVCGG